MKALQFTKYGAPSVLSMQDIAMPEPKQGEVLVEIKAAAINPSDIGNIAGKFQAELPRVPGRDYAGIVLEGGDWKGKEVWGSGAGFGVTRDGTNAQFVAVPLNSISEKPTSLSMEQAAAIGIPYLAAWMSLVRIGEVQEGELVLITGAAGSVGQAATQIAHWKKAIVVAVQRDRRNFSADHFISSDERDLGEEVKRISKGQGVDLVLDTVGGDLFAPCLKTLRASGRQIAIATSTPEVQLNLLDFYRNQCRLFGMNTFQLKGPEIAEIMNELRAGFEAGHLQAPTLQIDPFDKAIESYLTAAEGKLHKKQVLTLS